MPNFPSLAPLLLPYDGVDPQFETPPSFCGAGSAILGKVTTGARLMIGAGAVMRADGHFVRVGNDFCLGEGSSVHIAHEIYPAVIGDDVATGRNSVVHACTVGNRCAFEDNVVILDGAIVEDDVLVEAGSTVFPRARLASGQVYAGSPAKPVRALAPGERQACAARLRAGVGSTHFAHDRTDNASAVLAQGAFIALTARVSGRIICAEQASIFFGCDFDAGHGVISVGARTNVQDNSRVSCTAGGLTIGADVTIGHNVTIGDGAIGDRSLIGIGSVMAEGTIVGDDVLLAGGSTTLPGQKLESGALWAGRPARIIGRIDENKRKMMLGTVHHYCIYAENFGRAQDGLA